MPIQVFEHVKNAVRNLDPEDIRKHTDKPLRLLLYADDESQYRAMEDYLIPRDLSAAKRSQVRSVVFRSSDHPGRRAPGDLEVYFDPAQDVHDTGMDVYGFDPAAPAALVDQVLKQRKDLAIPLALHVLPFRQEVSHRMIKKVAKENALFSLATAIPDIVP